MIDWSKEFGPKHILVRRSRVVEAYQWILDHATFDDEWPRWRVEQLLEQWRHDGYYPVDSQVPFGIEHLTILNNDQRMLFKLTFAS